MGLDAFVFCDCWEKGRLRTPPPDGVILCVGEDGSLHCEPETSSMAEELARDEWMNFHACEHPSGILLHHRLGNIALIWLLRGELRREPDRFSMLLSKVVYSGSHAGDFILVKDIPALVRELEELDKFRSPSLENNVFLARFLLQMSELVAASVSVNKPIVF